MGKRRKRLWRGRDHSNVTVPSYISEIETESHRMLDTVEQTAEELSAYYLGMLQGNTQKEEIWQKEESLKRASNNLLKAWTQTYSMRDEFRWSRRMEGIEPSNAFWEWVDERFPDERMENVYANMKFTDQSEE